MLVKAVVVAGGTGGHIYPAIAIINKIKEREPDSEILYFGTTDRMEKDIIPKLNIPFIGLEMSGLNRKNPFKNISVLKKFFKAVKQAEVEIKKFNPDVVIGVGGYITAPVLYAAHRLKYPVVIHEQNSIAGLSNQFIANFADKVFVSLPGTVKDFPKNKVVYTGNPRSEEIVSTPKELKSSLGFDEKKKLVVVVMGSLGSTTMTTKLKELIPGFSNKSYQVLVITGKAYYDNYSDVEVPENVKIVPFMDNLINILKDSDLIVSRAGASTIAEITAIGLPAILVPSPYVTHNHQYLNALELKEAGACVLVTEEEFSKDKIILEIDKLFDNLESYSKMKVDSEKLGVKDSATKIYDEIKRLIG